MSWLFPFTCQVTPYAQEVTDGVAGVPRPGETQTVAMDIQDMTPEQAWKAWGIEIAAPAKGFCASADAAKFSQGAEVVNGAVTYTVHSVPVTRSAASELDYCLIILQRLTYTETE